MSKSYMSGTEYRRALEALGLPDHGKAGEFLHIDAKTSQRRATERRGIQWDTATLLRLMVTLKLKPEHLVNLLGKD